MHSKDAHRAEVLRLRGEGLTLNQIKSRVPVARSTISGWCRALTMTPEEYERWCQAANKRAYARRKSPEPTPRRKVKNCAVCGVPSRSRHCSPKCAHETRYQEFIAEWLAGGHRDGSRRHWSSKVPPQIRRYLFEKHGNACAGIVDGRVCGWSRVNPHTGKIPLEVEHVDGNCDNNTPENLTLLCPCCHALTATYRALNRGNGRRRKRHTIKV